MDAQKTRFEFLDPRDGDIGTMYTASTKEEIIQKAEATGNSRFNEVAPDGSITAHVQVDGEWKLASEIERQQKATAAVDALSRQIHNGVRENEARSQQTPEQLEDLAAAFREFGQDMNTETERRAAIGIEARSIAFANASADAKHDKLAALPAGDIGARMAELSRPEPNVLPADVSRQWAMLDAQEFAKIEGQGIQSDARRETAANAIAANMAANAEYKAALVEAAPAVAAAANEADAETNRGIERKATAKAMEAEAMAAVASRDADAFEIPQHSGERSTASGPEKTPAQALQSIQDRALDMQAEGLDVEDLAPDVAARMAREDQADYAKLDMWGKATAAYTIADNFRNRDYSGEFARHDPEAAQNVVREVARQDEQAAKQSGLSDNQLDKLLAEQGERDPFADPAPAQSGQDKQIGAPMVSMPGNVMVYNDQPGMAGAEIHTPDGRVISFGGKPAIEQFAEENNLAPEDKQKLLDLEAMADKYRNSNASADKAFDELDSNAKWDAAALSRMEEARRNEFAETRAAMGLNTIEPNIDREQQRREGEAEAGRQALLAQAAAEKQQPAKGAQQGQAPGGNGVESDEIFTATQADTKAIVPPEIEKQYLHVGDKFYHPKNTELVAFEDKGNKLETKSNSEAIAESMVRIAEARGWDEIKVTGSETFRREVWLEAAARGMHVKGYTPSEQDKAALAKRAGEAEVNRVEKETTPFRGRENEKSAPDSADKRRAEAFAKENPAEAVKKHPELAGAAAAMAAMDKKAEADGLNPAQRAVVAARVKQNVVNAIERGDIPEVKAREQAEQKREASNSREYAR